MYKKAQAAMEFLMTYGWAILVVLIAIGALAYFGVLNPSRFLPSSCTIVPGLGCDDFKIRTGTVNPSIIIVRNGFGSDLTSVTPVTLTSADGIVATGALQSSCSATANQIDDAAACEIQFTTGTSFGSDGSRFKGTISITYTKDTLSHVAKGDITTKIEP